MGIGRMFRKHQYRPPTRQHGRAAPAAGAGGAPGAAPKGAEPSRPARSRRGERGPGGLALASQAARGGSAAATGGVWPSLSTQGEPHCLRRSRARARLPLPTAWQPWGRGYSRGSPDASFRPPHNGQGALAGHPPRPHSPHLRGRLPPPTGGRAPSSSASRHHPPGPCRRCPAPPPRAGRRRDFKKFPRSGQVSPLPPPPPAPAPAAVTRAGGGPAGDGCSPRPPPGCVPGAAASFLPRYGFGDPKAWLRCGNHS